MRKSKQRYETVANKCRNQKDTLSQNYKRLGLASRLNDPTGGTEKSAATIEEDKHKKDTLNIGSRQATKIDVSEVRIERDPETGAITRVVEDETKRPNPLNDPLNDLEDSDSEGWAGFENEHGTVSGVGSIATGTTEVVRKLEEEASRPVEKKPRKQSEGEEEWIKRLVGKHGDDYAKMSRDMKMNPMQQSSGDLKRRVKKWRSSQASE